MKTTRYVQVLVVLLAVALCWSMLAPTAISADRTNSIIGGCKCNWNTTPTCPTSKDAPAGKECGFSGKKYAGQGSSIPSPKTYCTGRAYCDEVSWLTCPVG